MTTIASPSAVRGLLQEYGLHPKKSLGQNFLVDGNILKKIADASKVTADDYIVEIGPGLGVLTRELAERSRGVLAVDVDSSLQPVLNDLAGKYHNLRLLFQDILKIDLEAELIRAFNLKKITSFKVCANIPYNITTPLIFRLLQDCPHLESATLMIQKEVGDRLTASPGGKDYGRLTVMTAFYADVEQIVNVSRNCFYPRPEVDSAVVQITPRADRQTRLSETVFQDLLRVAFQKRRKTILNILSSHYNMDKAEIQTRLGTLGLNPESRPENLTIKDYINLSQEFAQ